MPQFTVPLKQDGLVRANQRQQQLEETGYYFCLGCKAPCEELANAGEHNQCCKKCRSMVQWVPPKTTARPTFNRRSSEVPIEQLSNQPAKMSFKEAAFNGFYTCEDCGHITTVQTVPGIGETCKLCGSPKVKFNKPVIGAEIVNGTKNA